jgi:acetyl-CoA acetyltransferase
MPYKPAHVLGAAEGHPDSPFSVATREDLMRTGTSKAAPRAFAMAGLSPRDVKLGMFYDPFTFMVLFQLELLGIVQPGEGGPFVEGGGIGLGGALPVNTHGGLHSQAHSMSGVNHIAEAVKQLRGTAGRAQVAQPSPCVVTGFGDFGDSAVALLAT